MLTMWFKSLYTRTTTNRRLKGTTSVVNSLLLYWLLSAAVGSFANADHHRLGRQLNTEAPVNYEDSEMTNSYHQPHFTGNRTAVVHLFEWKFVDIAAECRNFLGPHGYAGVQLSPVLEHTVVKSSTLNHPWWERYEVVSYRLASRSGDESEFWSMSRICNEQGVRIYVDVVLNHMAAPLHFVGVTDKDNDNFTVNTLLATNVNISQQKYANVSYSHKDFHRISCMVLDSTQTAYEIRSCQLNGHPDLDHSRGDVQKHIVEMLDKFVDMGVAGFRIDGAKYIWPMDLKKIFQQVKNLNTAFNFKPNSRPFCYYDVFDLGSDAVSKTEYATYGVVSEYLYGAELSTILNGQVPLTSLINWGPALGFVDHEDSLIFIDSHETQRGLPAILGNNHILTYKNRIKYIMANVFMLVHPYGAIKRIMSSYYFPRTDINQGPPVDEVDEEEIRSPKFNDQKQCTKASGWVCEHRWPALVNMLRVASFFKLPANKEESIIYFQTNGPNQVSFCRGRKAFVAINNDPENEFVKEVYACLEPGVYCDVVTGGKKDGKEECHGKIFEINENGYMRLNVAVADGSGSDYEEHSEANDDEEDEEFSKIESYGIIVLYIESKIELKVKQPANKDYEEAKDLEADVKIEQIDGHEVEKDVAGDKDGGDDTNTIDMQENAEAINATENHNDESAQENNEGLSSDNADSSNQDKTVEQTTVTDGETSLEQTEGQAIDAENLPHQDDEEDEIQNEDNEYENASMQPEEQEEAKQESSEAAGKETDEIDESIIGADNDAEQQNEEDQQAESEVPESKKTDETQPEEMLDDPPENPESGQGEFIEMISADTPANGKDENLSEEATEQTQSRNMDENIVIDVQQIEKPSSDIKVGSDVTTSKVEDIQVAGFLGKPRTGGG